MNSALRHPWCRCVRAWLWWLSCVRFIFVENLPPCCHVLHSARTSKFRRYLKSPTSLHKKTKNPKRRWHRNSTSSWWQVWQHGRSTMWHLPIFLVFRPCPRKVAGPFFTITFLLSNLSFSHINCLRLLNSRVHNRVQRRRVLSQAATLQLQNRGFCVVKNVLPSHQVMYAEKTIWRIL